MEKRAKIQGFNVDLLDMKEVLDALVSGINENRNIHVVTINPEIYSLPRKMKNLQKL